MEGRATNAIVGNAARERSVIEGQAHTIRTSGVRVPRDPRAGGYCDITRVVLYFIRSTQVSRVFQPHLEIKQEGIRNRRQSVGAGVISLGDKVEIDALAHIAETVYETQCALLHERDTRSSDLEIHLLGYRISLKLYDQFEVLLLWNLQRVVDHNETEGGLGNELATVRNEPFCAAGDQTWRCNEQDQKHKQRWQRETEIAFVASEVDRVNEGHRTEFTPALGDRGFDQLTLLRLLRRHVAELKCVEQLVPHFGEMRTHDRCGLFVREHISEAEDLDQRPCDEARKNHEHTNDRAPEKRRAYPGTEPAEALQ